MTEPAGPALARLSIVAPRDVWKHEAQDFTPWLLANADVLSDLLGMDLELEVAEHPVGSFSLDLLGRDAATGQIVIVENQLEESDHTHLGQILTYAAGTHPTTIVWVAPSFRPEHRAALDWLNSRTDEQTRFFGVEIGVVRISRHGGKVVTVARFVEGLRQANGIVAGITRMHWLKFLAFNALGAALWVGVWTGVGYASGSHINAIYGPLSRALLAIAAIAIIFVVVRLILRRRRRRHSGAEDQPATASGQGARP